MNQLKSFKSFKSDEKNSNLSSRSPASGRSSFSYKSGDRVEVVSDGKRITGFIKKMNRDLTYNVIYDNGFEDNALTKWMLRPLEMTPSDFVNACSCGNLDAVRTFVAAKGDLNAKDSSGMTGLEAACKMGESDVVAYLLENTSVTVFPGAFLAGVYGGFMAVVTKYFHQSGDPTVMTREGENAVDLALRRGWEDIASFLLDKFDATVSYASFVCGIECGFFPVVCKYMEQNVMEVGELGRTFDAAFKHGHIKVMKHAVNYRAIFCHERTERVTQLTPKTRKARVEEVKRRTVLDSFISSFQECCTNKKCCQSMDFRNTNLLRATDFMEQGRFLSYEECKHRNLLLKGADCNPDSKILVIVHPWKARDDNLDHDIPFKQAVSFIKEMPAKRGATIDLIWFDGSCVAPPEVSARPTTARRTPRTSRVEISCHNSPLISPNSIPPGSSPFGEPNATSTSHFQNNELHSTHVASLPMVIFASSYCLALPRLMVFEGFNTVAKEQYNKFTGMIYSDIDDMLSDAWCNIQILMSIISGSRVFCIFHAFKPHQICLLNFQRWDVYFINSEAVEIQDEQYSDPDVEKPASEMNVWFRSAALGALNKIKNIHTKRQLWYGILKDSWFLEIVDPTVTLAKCVLSVLDIDDNDPDLMKRLWSYNIHSEDMSQNRLTIMDEEGKEWDLSFDNIMHMLGYIEAGRDPSLALNVLLLGIAHCMGKEAKERKPEDGSAGECSQSSSNETVNITQVSARLECQLLLPTDKRPPLNQTTGDDLLLISTSGTPRVVNIPDWTTHGFYHSESESEI